MNNHILGELFEKYRNGCFYGCYLDKNNHVWSCKKSANREEADNWALEQRDKAVATRLVPVNCFIPDFINQMRLFKKVNFQVKQDVPFTYKQ
jgi:hypothetical protein